MAGIRCGLDPVKDRQATRRPIDKVVLGYGQRAMPSTLPALLDPRVPARAVDDAISAFAPLQRHLDDPEIEGAWIMNSTRSSQGSDAPANGPGRANLPDMVDTADSSARVAAAARMADAAVTWLDTLDRDQRDTATGAVPADDATDAERRSWFYTPTDHGGLTFHEQRPAQQRAHAADRPRLRRGRR